MAKKGVLLMNLGSPDSTKVADVRTYLREFLMDPRVLDAPWPIRFGVVHFAILPSRPRQSAEAYRSIWLPEGSPLIATSRKVVADLQPRLSVPVKLAMRYRHPSVPDALRELVREGVEDLLLIPLFPHYAMSSYETAVEHVHGHFRRLIPKGTLTVQPPYFDRPDYIDALCEVTREYTSRDYDHFLFSFHGIPERHIKKSDPTGNHCLASPDCCEGHHPAHQTCYRAQCLKTMHAMVAKLEIPAQKYSFAFQSRLGRDPWLKPATDEEIIRFANQGIQNLLIICPAFVTDCLETLEEIGIRGRESFQHAGGRSLTRIPCLNDHPAWLDCLHAMVREFLETTP